MKEDPFLKKRLDRYDEWLRREKISCSSKIIPVAEAFTAKQWVLPSKQAKAILGKARSIALTDCECRVHYKRCDNPVEVCLLLDEAGDKLVENGSARHITREEAEAVLRKTEESGLVHLCLYMPEKKIYAVCSCCSCCCHEFQIVKHYRRQRCMVRSDYVAETGVEACMNCGVCAERCLFEARTFSNGRMSFHPALCTGCGLCVSTCPAECITLKKKKPETVHP